jgi:uncharacterized membrane protein
MTQHLELPRPMRLTRTVAWNLAESVGIPIAVFAVAAWLGGRDAGLLAGVGAIWLQAAIRKLVTGSVPSLLTISAIVMTIQSVIAVATGSLWIFLLHFPLANLCLCLLFARTARTARPLCERLASEMLSLRHPAAHQPGLRRFFQHATWLWAGVFLLLAACMGVLLAVQPVPVFLLFSTVATIALIVAGIGVSVFWLVAVLNRHGLSFRFAQA